MKLAIITGASRGIGRETAKAFAKEGYSLLLNCEKNIALLEELKTEINQSPEIILKQGSFSSAFLENYFHTKESNRIEIDQLVLVINQGKSILRLAQDYTADEIDTLLQANLLEPFQLVQRMIP